MRREFKKLTRQAGLGDWSPYEMRHTAITLHSKAGVPIEQIADLAGHKDTRMLMNVYRHTDQESIDAGVSALEHLA